MLRVISLFYIGQWSVAVFEWAHLYLWQALIMLDVLIVWMIWIRTLPPRTAVTSAPAATPPPAETKVLPVQHAAMT